MSSLLRLIKSRELNYFRLLFTFLLAASANAICSIYSTEATGKISDAAMVNDFQVMQQVLLFMAVLTALRMIINMVTVVFTKRYQAKINQKLSDEFNSHINSISLKNLSAKSNGDLLSFFSNDLAKVGKLLVDDILPLLYDAAIMICAAIFMFQIHPWLSLGYFSLFVPLSYMQTLISKKINVAMLAASRASSQFNEDILDSLQNRDVIVAYNLEEYMEKRFYANYEHFFLATRDAIRYFVGIVCGGIFLAFLPTVLIYIVASFDSITGIHSLGTYITYTTLAVSANDWLSMLSQRLNSIQGSLVGVTRYLETTADIKEISSRQIINLSSNTEEALKIENLSFSYDDQNPVLENISLSVARGENIAFVGGSGSGKSTLLKLILTLYSAEQGEINILGNTVNEKTKFSLRNSLAYVPQDCFLFPSTIKENIVGNDKPDDSEVEWMHYYAKQAGIDSYIESLPLGYDTEINEAATNISGGQKQRLALARALYRNSPILLLDEATSALDTLNEREIIEKIYANRDQTSVLITHRLELTRLSDRIFVFEHGRLVEEGDFNHLLATQGVFANLYNRQINEEGENNG